MSKMMKKLDEIVDIFELLGDWDQRYQYLIELGEKLPSMPEHSRTIENQVRGCMSQVWVTATCKENRIKFTGDSDTSVIKGILALLIDLCNDMSVAEINTIDMDEIFTRLNLDEHLSPNRHVGVYAIFELMKRKAQAAEDEVRAA
jgi:cysteine desulfuration protein SufE